VAPVRELLARNNLTAADVDAIELLGGTSRVPRLKQALSEALGGRTLDMWVARGLAARDAELGTSPACSRQPGS
jgi:molecular chaperone DnaK (HSP70)